MDTLSAALTQFAHDWLTTGTLAGLALAVLAALLARLAAGGVARSTAGGGRWTDLAADPSGRASPTRPVRPPGRTGLP